jgi:hypothetical protein
VVLSGDNMILEASRAKGEPFDLERGGVDGKKRKTGLRDRQEKFVKNLGSKLPVCIVLLRGSR